MLLVGFGLIILILFPAFAFSQGLSNGRAGASECATIDVLIVSDRATYGPLPQARTRLLDTFTKAKAYFASAFDVELKMYVREMIIPTHEKSVSVY